MNKEDLDEYEKQLIDVIDRIGWMVYYIGADENNSAFCYTVGLKTSFNHPELIMVANMRPDKMHTLLNDAAAMIKDNKDALRNGGKIANIFGGGMLASVHTISRKSRLKYLKIATMWYDYDVDKYEALQIVIPDKYGKFPGEEGYDSQGMKSQKIL